MNGSKNAFTAIAESADLVLKAIKQHPEGIQSGFIYSNFMDTIDTGTYDLILSCLVRAGKITRSNTQYLKAV